MSERPRDGASIAGKFSRPEEDCDLLVVGGGRAGLTAAITARREGAGRVILVDENPIPPDLMGLDVPLFFGGRADASVRNATQALEQVIASEPLIETAFNAGVDVRLGTIAFGAWSPGPGLASLPAPVAGLADRERSWLCGWRRLLVAAGARDLVFGFPGWERPGVMGAAALIALVERYRAFAGRRLVILGTGPLAAAAARAAHGAGAAVAALLEVRQTAQSPDAEAAARLCAAPILCGLAELRAEGGLDGVTGVRLRLNADRPERVLDCDTVCLAVALSPSVELLAAMGARLIHDPARGGFAPATDAQGATSLPGVRACGACLGTGSSLVDATYAQDWLRALQAAPDARDIVVCQCEDVTLADLLELRQPRYLGPGGPALARRSLRTLAEDGPLHPDQVKRLTRAGMGVCQGRRCRDQVAAVLGLSGAAAPMASYRFPTRPLPLSVLADRSEGADMRAGWDVWFGIPSQWIPYQDIGTEREARHADPGAWADRP